MKQTKQVGLADEVKIHNHATELDELLDCPFCGGRPVAFLKGNEYLNKMGKKVSITVKCPNCRIERTDAVLRNSIKWLEEVAIKNWNTRNSAQAQQEAVERDRELQYELIYKIDHHFGRDIWFDKIEAYCLMGDPLSNAPQHPLRYRATTKTRPGDDDPFEGIGWTVVEALGNLIKALQQEQE